jgi:hypothetical protein
MKALNVLQGWAQEVIEKVAKKSLIEDDLIEFKRIWIKPHKAARRIAAHANAARGQDILWLIGVDPDAADPFFELQESKPEEWFAQVKAFFVDGHSPGVRFFHVGWGDKVLYAIVFDTSEFPFLISLKRYNQEEQKPEGVAENEVPWREGTSVRSAKRTEILSLLHKLPPLPTFEVLAAKCFCAELKIGESASCRLDLKFYVMPPTGQQPVVPRHRIRCVLERPNGEPLQYKGPFAFKSGESDPTFRSELFPGAIVGSLGVGAYLPPKEPVEDPILIRSTELVIREPGVLRFTTGFRVPPEIALSDTVNGKLILPVGSEGAVATVRFRAKNTREQ